MIQWIEIRNFQNHRHTRLVLGPGVNLIVGASDSGKSAVMRAVEWVRTNRPLGTSFMRHGAKSTDKTEVSVALLTGKRTDLVCRRRAYRGGVNQYQLNNGTFGAIGTDVPQEIEAVLRLSDVNIQSQLSPHFLVLDSPGAVAKAISGAIHLEQMDGCVKEANRRLRELQADQVRYEHELEQLEESQKEFLDLDDIRPLVKQARTTCDNLISATQQEQRLSTITTEVLGVVDQLAELPPKELLEEAESLVDLRREVYEEQSGLEALLDAVGSVEADLSMNNASMAGTYEQLSAVNICPLCGQTLTGEARECLLGVEEETDV